MPEGEKKYGKGSRARAEKNPSWISIHLIIVRKGRYVKLSMKSHEKGKAREVVSGYVREIRKFKHTAGRRGTDYILVIAVGNSEREILKSEVSRVLPEH